MPTLENPEYNFTGLYVTIETYPQIQNKGKTSNANFLANTPLFLYVFLNNIEAKINLSLKLYFTTANHKVKNF